MQLHNAAVIKTIKVRLLCVPRSPCNTRTYPSVTRGPIRPLRADLSVYAYACTVLHPRGSLHATSSNKQHSPAPAVT